MLEQRTDFIYDGERWMYSTAFSSIVLFLSETKK